jgi:hypothetical protein
MAGLLLTDGLANHHVLVAFMESRGAARVR